MLKSRFILNTSENVRLKQSNQSTRDIHIPPDGTDGFNSTSIVKHSKLLLNPFSQALANGIATSQFWHMTNTD